MSEAIDQYKEHREKVKKLLRYEDANRVLGRKTVNKFKKAIDIMDQNIMEIIKQEDSDKCEDIGVSREEFSKISNTVDIMLNQVTFNEITPWVRDFFLSYISFLSNWNDKVTKSNKLRDRAFAAKRIIEGHTTFKDMQNMCTRVINEIRPLLQKEPSSLKLSRHYAKKIREENRDD